MEALLRQYECVRVVDMAKVDLERFDFDFDLTFCLLLMESDGTILHTFGGRDASGAESHLDMEALRSVLSETLAERDPEIARKFRRHVPSAKRRTVDDFPSFAERRRKGEAKGCVHCHTIFQMDTESARAAGTFRRERAWRWPDPVQAGLVLEGGDQRRIASVVPGSPAAKAGLRAGDRLRKVAGRSVITFGDLQRILNETDGKGGSLELVWERGPRGWLEGTLTLEDGWRTPTPETYAWRSSKWPLEPKPGFGGPDLTKDEKRRLGVPPSDYAFRVNYLVTWGPDAGTGRIAGEAGLRKGDVVLSVAGKRDFLGQDHFHAWFRLTRKPGEKVPIEILRGGKRVDLVLPLPAR